MSRSAYPVARATLSSFGRARTGWVVCACPLGPWRHQDGSGKASFGLKTSAGLGGGPALAKCFSCDFVGTPAELLYEMLGRNRLSPSGKRYDFAGALAILADQSASASASGAAAQAAAAVAMVSPGLKSIDEATWGAPAELVFPESWLARFEPAYAAAGEVHPYLAGRGVPWRVARDLEQVGVELRLGVRRIGWPEPRRARPSLVERRE